MEVILSTGFGHKVTVIQGGEDELTKACASIFAAAREGSELSSTSTFLSMISKDNVLNTTANNILGSPHTLSIVWLVVFLFICLCVY